jgi:hypothetical protein
MPQQNEVGELGASARNFIRTIIASDVEPGRTRVVVTHFPPEPNGFLHLGHDDSRPERLVFNRTALLRESPGKPPTAHLDLLRK